MSDDEAADCGTQQEQRYICIHTYPLHIYVYMHMYIYMFMYLYMHRERERERVSISGGALAHLGLLGCSAVVRGDAKRMLAPRGGKFKEYMVYDATQAWATSKRDEGRQLGVRTIEYRSCRFVRI